MRTDRSLFRTGEPELDATVLAAWTVVVVLCLAFWIAFAIVGVHFLLKVW